MTTAERPLTPSDVAKTFQVTTETVRRWAETQRLRGFRTPSGQWRFRREDVEAFLIPKDAA